MGYICRGIGDGTIKGTTAGFIKGKLGVLDFSSYGEPLPKGFLQQKPYCVLVAILNPFVLASSPRFLVGGFGYGCYRISWVIILE